MKLKYYLRGVGVGIVFATVIMTVSSLVHKYNITDEYIIKEARKLGMVMKEELNENNGLFGKDESEETEETQETEGTQGTEDTQASENTQGTEQENSDTTENVNTEGQPSESQMPSESEITEYATIVVEGGDSAHQVAKKAKEAGLVDDAEEFRLYLRDHGYAYDIRVGTYQIPIGVDYEEICKILTIKDYQNEDNEENKDNQEN